MEGGQQHKGGPGGAAGDNKGGADNSPGALEAKLRKAIHAGGDEGIEGELKKLEAPQRPMARMLLIRELSPARAETLWSKAFGDQPVAPPPPASAGHDKPMQAGPGAQLALARAKELQSSLHASLLEMRAAPEQMMQPLQTVEPHVADAALTQLHAQPFDARRSAYQILDELTHGGAKALLTKSRQHAGGDQGKEKKLDFRSGAARQWASKVVAALERGATPAAVAGSLLLPSSAPAWASLRLALKSEPSRLPGLVEQMLDHLETMLKGVAEKEIVPAELAGRIAAELGPVTARIHVGADAAKAAADHDAKAVTIGEDVFVGADQWKPGTPEGDFLIAHELAHVAQVQQKRLHEAAPLAIETGRVVNDSEVEADLKARLVVARGNYTVTVGAAPAATGMPADDGQRAAQLTAQRARIDLASQSSAAEPAADAGAGGAGGAPGADTAAQQKSAPAHHAAPAADGSAGAYTGLFASPPSQHPYDWDKIDEKASSQLKSEEGNAVATIPSFDAEMEGKDAGAKAGEAGAGAAANIATKDDAGAAMKAPPMPTLPPITGNQGAAQLADRVGGTADKQKLKSEGMNVLRGLQTKDPDLKTAPGPSPVVELAGGSDPVQTVEAEGQAKQQAHDELGKQRDKILAGPGPAQVQPIKVDEKLKMTAGDLQLGPMPTLPAVPDMELMKGWKQHTTGPVKAAFDEIAQPKLDASIAPARDKVMQASTERETSRAKAIGEAQQKTAQANAEAQTKQASAVQQARSNIASQQQATLQKQKQAVSQLEDKANTKRAATLSKIDERVASDQQQITSQYQQAEQQATAEQQRGEEEAEQKRQEAERQANQEQSWWDRAVSVVTSAIQAVAHAVDAVLSAVRSAVGHIIDAVKSAAMAVIDAARNFIVAAIGEFGHWLQDLVNATIGQLFPELAAALNSFIDRAVSAATAAVNAIADGLKRAVAALLDGLKAGINALIDAYRAAVQAAAAFATALVTGDWSVVGRMLLEGILRLCGIDPAQFYALIGQARDTIHLILDDPGAFANHVVDAVKLGFQQFGNNFLTHLRDGIVQWLFGQFADQGITMPATFDIAGVFGLVAQVLGLTYPRLRQKAVRLIGERNVERIEFVWRYVEALLTGGWAGLWERIQQDLSSLWDTVIEGVKSWLLQHIVQAAIVRLATMWNPAGAIINLIMTAWNVYQWVRENAQRLFGLLQSVVQSMSAIAHGEISGAANFIESSLARLVPIAISLLANLLGLGGIADRIREIITNIQNTVDTALDRLIERVMALFRGGGDKDKKEDDDNPKFPAGTDAQAAVAYANWAKAQPESDSETLTSFHSHMTAQKSYDFVGKQWHGLKEQYLQLSKGSDGKRSLEPDPFAAKMYGGHHMPGPTLAPGWDPDAKVPDGTIKSLVEPSPARLDQLSDKVSGELSSLTASKVIFVRETPAKEAVKQILSQHTNAKLDTNTAALTLPPVDAAPLMAAESSTALGSLIAQQTGVSKVTIEPHDKSFKIKGEVNPIDWVAYGSMTAWEKRFAEARAGSRIQRFSRRFTTEDWEQSFSVSRSTADADLLSGRTVSPPQAQKVGTSDEYVLLPMSASELVHLATERILLGGRRSPVLTAKKTFSLADIVSFCTADAQLPSDATQYGGTIPQQIADGMVAAHDVKVKKLVRENKYYFETIPATRDWPPDGRWAGRVGEQVRAKYYENGSTFGTNSVTIRNRGLADIQAVIDLFLPPGGGRPVGTAASRAAAWTALGGGARNKKLVVDTVFDPTKAHNSTDGYLEQAKIHADHIEALASHWEDGGYNGSTFDRTDTCGRLNNLRPMHEHWNTSRGAEGSRFTSKLPGPNFNGPGQDAGLGIWAADETGIEFGNSPSRP